MEGKQCYGGLISATENTATRTGTSIVPATLNDMAGQTLLREWFANNVGHLRYVLQTLNKWDFA